jgi:predicted DNA binding CopG/RHH family protein
MMRQSKLTKAEQAIERALLAGEYGDASRGTFAEIAEAIARRRKDAVISIRVNSRDLQQIKAKAKRLGVGYQTLISEVLHRVAA